MSVDVKLMTIDDILSIPSDLLTTNHVAGSKVLELDETDWKRRAIGYATHSSVEVLGAYNADKILGVAFVIWPKISPGYMISNLRLFHNFPGFPVDKNGYGALLSTAIETGESQGRWEFYMRRNLDYGRWFNKRYQKKTYENIPISKKYLRSVEEIIPANNQSKWIATNTLCNNEIVGEDTIIVKYFCPQNERNMNYIPEAMRIKYKNTLDVLTNYKPE